MTLTIPQKEETKNSTPLGVSQSEANLGIEEDNTESNKDKAVLIKKPSITPRGLAGNRPQTAKPMIRPGFSLSSILGQNPEDLMKEKAEKLKKK